MASAMFVNPQGAEAKRSLDGPPTKKRKRGLIGDILSPTGSLNPLNIVGGVLGGGSSNGGNDGGDSGSGGNPSSGSGGSGNGNTGGGSSGNGNSNGGNSGNGNGNSGNGSGNGGSGSNSGGKSNGGSNSGGNGGSSGGNNTAGGGGSGNTTRKTSKAASPSPAATQKNSQKQNSPAQSQSPQTPEADSSTPAPVAATTPAAQSTAPSNGRTSTPPSQPSSGTTNGRLSGLSSSDFESQASGTRSQVRSGLTTGSSRQTSNPAGFSSSSEVYPSYNPSSTSSSRGTAVSDSSKSSSGSNAGAIAGSVIGVLAALALLVTLIVFLLRRRRKREQALQDGDFDHLDEKSAFRGRGSAFFVAPILRTARSVQSFMKPPEHNEQDRPWSRLSDNKPIGAPQLMYSTNSKVQDDIEDPFSDAAMAAMFPSMADTPPSSSGNGQGSGQQKISVQAAGASNPFADPGNENRPQTATQTAAGRLIPQRGPEPGSPTSPTHGGAPVLQRPPEAATASSPPGTGNRSGRLAMAPAAGFPRPKPARRSISPGPSGRPFRQRSNRGPPHVQGNKGPRPRDAVSQIIDHYGPGPNPGRASLPPKPAPAAGQPPRTERKSAAPRPPSNAASVASMDSLTERNLLGLDSGASAPPLPHPLSGPGIIPTIPAPHSGPSQASPPGPAPRNDMRIVSEVSSISTYSSRGSMTDEDEESPVSPVTPTAGRHPNPLQAHPYSIPQPPAMPQQALAQGSPSAPQHKPKPSHQRFSWESASGDHDTSGPNPFADPRSR